MQADLPVVAEIKVLSLRSVLNWNPEQRRRRNSSLGSETPAFSFLVRLLELFFFPLLYKPYGEAEANA